MTHRSVFPPGMTAQDVPLKLSPGILSNDHVFLTGMTGSLENGRMPTDPAEQFHAAFRKIGQILQAADLDFGAIVEMTSYHIGIHSHFACFASVQGQYVQEPFPAWTAVEVAGLRRAGALVEIRVIARAC